MSNGPVSFGWRAFYIHSAALDHDAAHSKERQQRAGVGLAWRFPMSERELIEPHEIRYQRRNNDGTFAESDDQHRSLSQDAKREAKTAKPKNEGDRGD